MIQGCWTCRTCSYVPVSVYADIPVYCIPECIEQLLIVKLLFPHHLSLTLTSPTHRVFEAILIIMVTTCVVFVAAMFLGTCVVTIDAPLVNSCAGDNSYVNQTHDYYCPNYGAYYNDMATLMFNSQEITIKQLFHENSMFLCLYRHSLMCGF